MQTRSEPEPWGISAGCRILAAGTIDGDVHVLEVEAGALSLIRPDGCAVSVRAPRGIVGTAKERVRRLGVEKVLRVYRAEMAEVAEWFQCYHPWVAEEKAATWAERGAAVSA